MEYGFVVLLGLVLLLIVRAYAKSLWLRRIKPYRGGQVNKLLTERLIKIMWNPFHEQHWWTKFNLQNRTWEWVRVATDNEVLSYDGLVLTEEVGDKILALEDNRG